jgi:transposase
MWEILSVLRRVARGESQAQAARATGHGRNTVRRYLERARALGWEPGEREPDEALALGVARGLRPGPRAVGPGAVEQVLLPHRERIRSWLVPAAGERRGLRLSKVHLLLGREGIAVAYSSLHRFALKHCGFGERKRVTVRVADVAPGELAEVDLGRLGLMPEAERGRRRLLFALIVTLVFSRNQFVLTTHSQRIADLIEGLEEAWHFFGGVVRRVVLDNLPPAVRRADRYEPLYHARSRSTRTTVASARRHAAASTRGYRARGLR